MADQNEKPNMDQPTDSLEITTILPFSPKKEIQPPTIKKHVSTSSDITLNADVDAPSFSSTSPPCTMFTHLRAFQRSSKFQLTLAALLCFLGPGMWNALNGMGGAGLIDAGPSNASNTAVYTTFAIGGFFGGIIANRLGLRVSFVVGELAFALYTAAMLTYKHVGSKVFIIAAGVQLGFSAGWFWTAQTITITSYPTEGGRGKAVAVWGLFFNAGACIGSLVAFLRARNSSAGQIDDATFIIIISLSVLGAILALLVCNPKDVVRSDGTEVQIPGSPTWKEATLDLWKFLKQEPHLIFIFPMYFASNFFYPYQFNTFNLKHFTIRTRALNNIIYWLAEIAGNLIAGSLLDAKPSWFSTKHRAQITLCMLLLSACAVWTCALFWERSVGSTVTLSEASKIDYTSAHYVTGAAMYAGFGLLASIYQVALVWLLHPICPNDENRTHLGGIFKGIQSAGGAVAFHINTIGISATTELAINWGLLAGSIVVAAPMVFMKTRNSPGSPSGSTASSAIP